jgi:Pyridoxal-phosphate dependent enzyme
MLSVDDVHEAAKRLRGVARRTPVLNDAALDAMAGCSIVAKAEMLQIGGAFKFRGEYNRLRSLSDAERRAGVVPASSGNHAQALAALAARLFDTTAIVFMPHDAPTARRAAAQRHGAQGTDFRSLYRRSGPARRGGGRRDWTHGREWIRGSSCHRRRGHRGPRTDDGRVESGCRRGARRRRRIARRYRLGHPLIGYSATARGWTQIRLPPRSPSTTCDRLYYLKCKQSEQSEAVRLEPRARTRREYARDIA